MEIICVAAQLQRGGINGHFAGSAMMDTLIEGPYDARRHRRNLKAITVLPGSRASLRDNFAVQLDALRRVPGIEGVDVFAVLARPGDAAELDGVSGLHYARPAGRDGDLGTLTDGRVTLHLSSGSLGAVLAASDVVLGQAGTANQQAFGSGRPVVGFHAEAERPKRRLQDEAIAGEARLFTERDPDALAAALAHLLVDDADRLRRGAIGRDRMGPPGVIPAIIKELTR